MVDGAAQRLTQPVLGDVDHGPQQRIGHVAAGGRGDAQHALGPAVELRDPLEQQVPEDVGQVHPAATGGGQQLLGEERVALGAGDDRLGLRGREWRPAAADQQGLQLLAVQRPQLQSRPRPGAQERRDQPAERVLGRRLVAAVGPDQQHPLLGEVVGDEGDQVEGRAVGPVEVLEGQDHGSGRRDHSQQRQQLLQEPELGR
jgi:hypothetical protein